MKKIVLCMLVFCTASSLLGQTTIDKNLLVDPASHRVDVYLRPESLKRWNDINSWTLIEISQSGDVQKLKIKEIDADSANSMFSIVLSDSGALANAVQLIVKFGAKDITVYQILQSTSGGHQGKPPSAPSWTTGK